MLHSVYRRTIDCFRRLRNHVAKKQSETKVNVIARPRSRQFTIAVEGNIACGKTSFLEHLSCFLPSNIVQVQPEPVDKWRDIQGHNLLDMFYKSPERWCMLFQTYVQLTMLQLHMEKSAAPIKAMERSIYSARNCFVENLYHSGVMPSAEYAVLSEWFDWISDHLDIGVDLIIYLRTTPEVVYKRIRQRARGEENPISLDYLHALHQLHENWLYHKSAFPPSSPVIILDANKELTQVHEESKNLGIWESIQNSLQQQVLSFNLNTDGPRADAWAPKWAQKRQVRSVELSSKTF